MQDAGNFNSVFEQTVKDNMPSNRKTPEVCGYIFTPSAHLRHCCQLWKPGNDGNHHFIRRRRIILRYVKPNFIQICARRRSSYEGCQLEVRFSSKIL